MVRGAVGVADASSLGKIELGGPDAGAFLDFVYAGRMSTLAEGRVRYGIMLREDGHVMDDGTCARLGAGAVAGHDHDRGGGRRCCATSSSRTSA